MEIGKRVDGYRYGFNGMERDDEWNGLGNSYDFGARICDSRVGRWLARDPLEAKYAHVAPYIFTLNNPIFYVDPDGKDVITHHKKINEDGTVITFTTVESKNVKWKVNDQTTEAGLTAYNQVQYNTVDLRKGILPEENQTYTSELKDVPITFSEYVNQKGVALDRAFTGKSKLRVKGGVNFYTTDGSSGGQEMAIGELAEFIDATDLIAAVTGFKGAVGGPGTGLGPSQKDMENAVILLAETLSKVVQVSGVYIDEMKKVGEAIKKSSEKANSESDIEISTNTRKFGGFDDKPKHYIDTTRRNKVTNNVEKDTTNNQVSEKEYREHNARSEND